jgi:hypothetical protein
LTNHSPQRTIHKIQVEEFRGIFDKSVAIFYVTLEVLVLRTIRYVEKTEDGWLKIRLEGHGKVESIPYGLKVEVHYVDSKREYFTIIEGVYRGKKASVKLKQDGSSYFSAENQQTAPVHLIYSSTGKTLTLNGKIYRTEDHPSSPWKNGLYDIEIPDAPHEGGLNYTEVRYARTWFRVGHKGDRYIHTGRLSLGCITLIERHRWDELYGVLINARKGDGLSIGTLEVIE